MVRKMSVSLFRGIVGVRSRALMSNGKPWSVPNAGLPMLASVVCPQCWPHSHVTDPHGTTILRTDSAQKFENIYKDDATGNTFVKLNGGNSLAIVKENDANRIFVADWSEARSLGIGLQGNAPTPPAATLTGDFKKAIDDRKAANDHNHELERNAA